MRCWIPALAMMTGCSAVGIRVADRAHSEGAGAVAPGFALASQRGTTVTLEDTLAGGAAMLVFYRGAW